MSGEWANSVSVYHAYESRCEVFVQLFMDLKQSIPVGNVRVILIFMCTWFDVKFGKKNC